KEKEDWKREAHSARKVYQETKQHKEQTDFLSEFKKLQAKKGFQ
ncbi:14948_t:CDS:1, partial [Funneliformis geosporum]